MFEAILVLFRQGGLSLAGGISPIIPLAAVALLARSGSLTLQPSGAFLAADGVLVGLVLLAACLVVGLLVPPLGAALRRLELPLALTAGALLFASLPSPLSDLHPGLALAIGAVLAGLVVTIRSAIQSLADRAPLLGGFCAVANVAVSGLLTATALSAPLLLPVLVLGLTVVGSWLTAALISQAGKLLDEKCGPLLQALRQWFSAQQWGSSTSGKPAQESLLAGRNWLDDQYGAPTAHARDAAPAGGVTGDWLDKLIR